MSAALNSWKVGVGKGVHNELSLHTDVVSLHEERMYGIIGSVHGGWDTTRAM
jgi:hypothetical protein